MIMWMISKTMAFAATHLCAYGVSKACNAGIKKISSAYKTITVSANKNYIIIDGNITEINQRKCYQIYKGVLSEVDPKEMFVMV